MKIRKGGFSFYNEIPETKEDRMKRMIASFRDGKLSFTKFEKKCENHVWDGTSCVCTITNGTCSKSICPLREKDEEEDS